MLLHLTVVENDHTGVSVVLLLHLVFGIDALPLDLGTRKSTNIYVSDASCDASSRERQQKQQFHTQDRQHTSVYEFIRDRSHQAFNEATANKRAPKSPCPTVGANVFVNQMTAASIQATEGDSGLRGLI